MLIKLSNFFSHRKATCSALTCPQLKALQLRGRCGGPSHPRLNPVGQLKQGLLAVNDIQVIYIGFQLLVLLWRHVTSKLISPAVSQGSDSVGNHVLQGRAGNVSMEGSLRVLRG